MAHWRCDPPFRAIYEAFGHGDVPTILDKLTDDVDWATDAASDDAPWYGERHGKQAVIGFFEGIAGAIDVDEFTPLAIAATDSEVLTLAAKGSAR